MQEILVFASILSPIVTALVELVKQSISLPKNILPLLGFMVGLGVGAIAYPFTEMDLVMRLWAGGFAGLAGTGIFELFKKRPGNTKQPKAK